MMLLKKLQPKDIEILTNLGLTILAQFLERGLPKTYAAPQASTAIVRDASVLEPAP